MVRKNQKNPKLEINTATRKVVSLFNTSRQVSVPVTFALAGVKESFILPPNGRFTLPEGAQLITKNQLVKEL